MGKGRGRRLGKGPEPNPSASSDRYLPDPAGKGEADGCGVRFAAFTAGLTEWEEPENEPTPQERERAKYDLELLNQRKY